MALKDFLNWSWFEAQCCCYVSVFGARTFHTHETCPATSDQRHASLLETQAGAIIVHCHHTAMYCLGSQ